MPLLAGAHILLVEDEPLIGMIVQVCLEEEGAEVFWAQTDRHAYEILETFSKLDLLITDINLREGTTGFDVSRFARRLNAALPVIYLSGDAPGSIASFGVDGAEFLLKPVTEAKLLSAATALLAPAEAGGAPMPRAT
jgi:DNA-binding response OmpR family regulator